jgi:hypothetical protein
VSESALKHEKQRRRLCAQCRDRKARFQYRGVVGADRHHTLCFACFRAQREHNRALKLADVSSPSPPSPFGARPPLNARETAHRRAMLEYFERRAAER